MTSANSKSWLVPFNNLAPSFTLMEQEIKEACHRVLQSNRYILGPELEQFEKEFAEYTGTKYCVGVASGTDAITISLIACGLGPNDKVATVANSAPATVTAIRRAGCRVVYVDIDDHGLMDVNSLKIATLVHKPRAVVPVHLYGRLCDLETMYPVASDGDCLIIEDAAQAAGSRLGTSYRFSLNSQMACFSFYPTKNLGALGDGGAVVTNDKDLARDLRVLRFYGIEDGKQRTHGFNSRLDELQAAILRTRLRKLDAMNSIRRQKAAQYYGSLEGIEWICLPPMNNGFNYHLMTGRFNDRDHLIKHLESKGIQTLVHYPIPSFEQPSEVKIARLEGEEGSIEMGKTRVHCQEILSLPLWYGIKDDQIKLVCSEIRRFYGK